MAGYWGCLSKCSDFSFAGAERQFKKYSHGQIDSLGVVYDYGSVMHYPRWAFSKNGRDTIGYHKRPGVVSLKNKNHNTKTLD